MQTDDVNAKGILVFLGILLGTMVIFNFYIIGLSRVFEKRAERRDAQIRSQGPSPSVAASEPYFPEPREQTNAEMDLEKWLARQSADLHSYGWIDRSNGVVRIPIERAIELLTPKGTP